MKSHPSLKNSRRPALYINPQPKVVHIIEMSVDKFGRHSGKHKTKRGPPGVGFVLTAGGHFSMQNKRLRNLSSPSEPFDAATKIYVDNMHDIITTSINDDSQKRDNLRASDLKGLMDINSKVDGILSSLPNIVTSQVSKGIADPLQRIDQLEQNLKKYTESENLFRMEHATFQNATRQSIVECGLTLTAMVLKVEALEKAVNQRVSR